MYYDSLNKILVRSKVVLPIRNVFQQWTTQSWHSITTCFPNYFRFLVSQSEEPIIFLEIDFYSLGSYHIPIPPKMLTHYSLSSRKRPPRLDILGGRLREFRLYCQIPMNDNSTWSYYRPFDMKMRYALAVKRGNKVRFPVKLSLWKNFEIR